MIQSFNQLLESTFNSHLTLLLVSSSLWILLSSLLLWMYIQARGKNKFLQQELDNERKTTNQVKSQFVANISHEIRTPLNAILGHAQLLIHDEDLQGKKRQNLQNILSASEKLSDLINDLLDIASIESDSMTLYNKDFDLTDMLHGLSRLFEKNVQKKV